VSTEDLLHQFAARIVSLSQAMGLDDEDERLLWEYLATLPDGTRFSKGADAIKLLKKYAETSPVLVRGWKVSACIDPIFIKPRKGLLARLINKPLHFTDESSVVMVCHDQDELLAKITRYTQMECFKLWFDRLQSVLRDDGVNWNPPVSTDIMVTIELNSDQLLPDQPSLNTPPGVGFDQQAQDVVV